MKIIIILIVIFSQILLFSYSYSQTNPRRENQNYMQTKLNEDFNTGTLNRDIWDPSTRGLFNVSNIDILIWVDSVATVKVNQNTGSLDLSMLSSPNYTTTDRWGGQTITANFIAGQVRTYERYGYGIFECNATFACLRGSFPAFWIYSDLPNSVQNEIDFVELKYNHDLPTLDNHIFYYPIGSPAQGYEFTQTPFYYWLYPHTFKCIWTPSRIEFWVDDTKLKEVQNTGQFWYPQLASKVHLSQQIVNYENYYAPQYGINTPQTSSFHWVKVREFFLAPEITLSSNIICSTGTASMNVDPAATNITWQLTPSYLFTVSSGNGSTANIVRASGANGAGKITYSFQMPSGETFTAQKDISVGAPLLSYITDPTGGSNPFNFYAVPSPGSSTIDNYTWIVSPDAYIYSWMDHAEITFPEPNYYYIGVEATNACGCSNRVYKYFMYYGDFLMSPNPASTEVEITISAGLAEGSKSASLSSDDEYTVTVLDIYGTVKIQKKYSGNKFTIPVSNLKDGNYIVKVNNKKINSSKQLIVKH